MANLFLYYYERKWILQTLKKRALQNGKIFLNILMLSKDLCTFYNDKYEKNDRNTYTDKMELKKENEDPCKTSFLEIYIEVRDRKFTSELLDESDFFLFYVNRLSYLDSNVSYKTRYALISSEILSIARTATHLINIATSVNLFQTQIKNQGSEFTRIISMLKKLFGKHFKVLYQLADRAGEFIKLPSS